MQVRLAAKALHVQTGSHRYAVPPISKAQWLSWLERRPVTAEVTGSSPVWVVNIAKSAAVAELADARDLKSRG